MAGEAGAAAAPGEPHLCCSRSRSWWQKLGQKRVGTEGLQALQADGEGVPLGPGTESQSQQRLGQGTEPALIMGWGTQQAVPRGSSPREAHQDRRPSPHPAELRNIEYYAQLPQPLPSSCLQ